MQSYIGNEQFSLGGRDIELTVNDFWRWTYSDLRSVSRLGDLSEFIVASSLESISDPRVTDNRLRRIVITKDGLRAAVRAASYVQSDDGECPNQISFSIDPGLPSGSQRSGRSDVYIFCLYKAMSATDSPINLDLWEFYVLRSKTIDEKMPTSKTITFQSLLKLEPVWSDYYGIGEAIHKTMAV